MSFSFFNGGNYKTQLKDVKEDLKNGEPSMFLVEKDLNIEKLTVLLKLIYNSKQSQPESSKGFHRT